jgi:hypothetical protein
MRVRGTVAVAVVLIGCSPFGEDARPEAEAGMPATTDAGDAGADASPVDAAAPPFESCANTIDPTRIFCSDFEDPALGTLPFGWTDEWAGSAGTTALAAGVGKGATRGLRVSLPNAATGGRARWLRFELDSRAAGAAHLEMSFDFLLEKGELDYHVIAAFYFGNNVGPVEHAGIAMFGRGAKIDSMPPEASPDVSVNVVGSFHHAAIRMDREQGSFVGRVITIDGREVERTPGIDLSQVTFADCRMGIFYTSGNQGAASVVFDNVVVRRF